MTGFELNPSLLWQAVQVLFVLCLVVVVMTGIDALASWWRGPK